ncbi:MAG TPA: TetR/AcrR family transcriptional regulator [Myxococcaceae bacterium]|jgi:TetR/AcrR family fatty acid metabolism transcriptional regulator
MESTPEAPEQARKATILRAAVDIFASKGYHGCRIADVAKQAGVAYGLVYHYFKNKDELLEAVFQQSSDWLFTNLKAVIDRGGSVPDVIRGITAWCFNAYREDPRAMKVLVLQVARGPALPGQQIQSKFVEIIQLLIQMFTRAIERGELRKELDPALLAAQLFGTVEMGLTSFVMGLYDAGDEAMLKRAASQVSECFLSGITGAPAPREVEWKTEASSTG